MINYYLLTKPGIILGNLVTFAAGFLLASKGTFQGWLFIETLLGLALIIASACVLNNVIDRPLDAKMERTKHRVLVRNLISKRQALQYAFLLGIAGSAILYFFTNGLAFSLALAGLFIYVVLYSFWKIRTLYATAIGSVAGAIPPVVGYCAVSHTLDNGALLLFFLLVFWQMPHFYAITLYHYHDYAAAKIPALPFEKGLLRTKIHMVAYIFAFFATSLLLTYFHYTGVLYTAIATLASLVWLWSGFKGFKEKDPQKWGRMMFRQSLYIIAAICLTLPF